MDGQDGNGLQLEKLGQLFQVVSLSLTKINDLKHSYSSHSLQKFTWYLADGVIGEFWA